MRHRLTSEPQTDAEDYIQRKLHDIMSTESKYRVGAIFLTYGASGNEEPGCRIAQVIGMKEVDIDSAIDFLQLIKAFRNLADQLEEKYFLKEKVMHRNCDGSGQ